MIVKEIIGAMISSVPRNRIFPVQCANYMAKVKRIKIPVSLDSDLRDRVLEAYSQAIEEVGEAERLYITERLPRVLARLQKFRSAWGLGLSQVAEALYDLLNNKDTSPKLLPETKQVLVAALFYLCNPYDVIPDFTPGIGYIDDAIILDECLKRMKKIQPALYKRTFAS